MCEYGIQLYSVRDITENDLLGAIHQVAAMGYKGMEFAGYFDHSAEEIKACMDAAGVSAWGTHIGYDTLREDVIDETIAYHQAIGCNLLIIPWADLSTLDSLKELAGIMEKALPKLEKAGMTLAYHNHSHEFMVNQDGIVPFDWMMENTQIKVELDTFWAYNADKDPIAMMEALGDRLVAIHIKDGEKGGEGNPLGQGKAPVKAVHDYAKAHGIMTIVESETLNPDGPAEAKICIDYLRQLDA